VTISLRRIIPVLCTLLVVLYLAGCHNSPKPTQAANTGVSSSPTGNNASSNSNPPNTPPVANAEASPSAEMNDANASANNASPPAPAIQAVTIPAGTVIKVRLLDSLSSARNHAGDVFAATVAQPVFVNGWEVIPRGTSATGHVLMARPSGHLRTPAELSITLASIQVDGETYKLRTSHIFRRGASHAKHNAKWIGGLAAGGALLGGLLGHGKGAVVGAGVGAGAGTATAYETGKKNIYLPSEQHLTFILRQPLTLSRVR